MIVSDTINRPNSRWLQAWVLLCAVVVLPLGVAQAEVVAQFVGQGVFARGRGADQDVPTPPKGPISTPVRSSALESMIAVGWIALRIVPSQRSTMAAIISASATGCPST